MKMICYKRLMKNATGLLALLQAAREPVRYITLPNMAAEG